MFCFIKEMDMAVPSLKNRISARSLVDFETVVVKSTSVLYVSVGQYERQSERQSERVRKYVVKKLIADGIKRGVLPKNYQNMGIYNMDTMAGAALVARRCVKKIMEGNALDNTTTDVVLCAKKVTHECKMLAMQLAEKMRHVAVCSADDSELADTLYTEFGMAKKAEAAGEICVFWDGEVPRGVKYLLDLSGGAQCQCVRYAPQPKGIYGYENNEKLHDKQLIFALISEGCIAQNEIMLDIV